jgi:glycosyltransferase involved in cell wall biosynthesis
MRLLVIGHSFLTTIAQRKYAAMRQARPSLAIRILTIDQLTNGLMTYRFERHHQLQADEVLPVKTLRPFRSNMTYMFRPGALYRHLRDFNPDVIHIEEEPHALITAETISIARLAAPSAAISVFVWDNIFRRREFPLGHVKRALDSYSLSKVAVAVCGNTEAQGILHQRRKFDGASVVLPQLGVDPIEHSPADSGGDLRRRLGIGTSPCVGYVGRLVKEKGVHLLCEAMESLTDHDWKLLIVGGGPLSDDLREWSARMNGRVVIVPAVRLEEVPQYLAAVDIFVLPSLSTSRWKEQFGYTLAQAMMSGKACVGSSSGAIPEVIGGAGEVFQERSATDLTQSLRRLLLDPEYRSSLGHAARRRAVHEYSNEAVGGKYLALFEKTAALRHSGTKAHASLAADHLR